jgi:hypothetical protein
VLDVTLTFQRKECVNQMALSEYFEYALINRKLCSFVELLIQQSRHLQDVIVHILNVMVETMNDD